MRKLLLILTIVCLLVTLTVLTAVPVSANDLKGTLNVDAPRPEDPSDPTPYVATVWVPPEAYEGLSKAEELAPVLEYEPGYIPEPPPDPQL